MQNFKKISIIFALSVCSATMIAKSKKELKPAQPVKSFAQPISMTIQNLSKDSLIVQEQISGGKDSEWLPAETLATIPAGASNSITVKIPLARDANLLFNTNTNKQTHLMVVNVAKNNPLGVTLVPNNGSLYTYSPTGTITQMPTVVNPSNTQTGAITIK